jgi:hypothetical protein
MTAYDQVRPAQPLGGDGHLGRSLTDEERREAKSLCDKIPAAAPPRLGRQATKRLACQQQPRRQSVR